MSINLAISQPHSRCPHTQISKALEKVALEKGLQLHVSWLNKCIQLYETYLVRHGIMLVGPTGGGKSAIEECLAGALTELGTKHVIWRMNPKVRLERLFQGGCYLCARVEEGPGRCCGMPVWLSSTQWC
jgi:hypothetical protein